MQIFNSFCAFDDEIIMGKLYRPDRIDEAYDNFCSSKESERLAKVMSNPARIYTANKLDRPYRIDETERNSNLGSQNQGAISPPSALNSILSADSDSARHFLSGGSPPRRKMILVKKET